MCSYVRAFLIILITLYMAIIFESISFALLGFTEAVLFVCSFLLLLFLKKRMTVELQIPIHMVEKNRPCYFSVRLTSPTGVFAEKARVYLEYGKSNRKKRKKTTLLLRVNQKSENDISVAFGEAANYMLSIRKVRIYDLTGIFYLEKKCSAKANVLVLPELCAIPIEIGERVHNFFGDADTFDDLRPGYDPSETFGVREFRDGDRMQNVHWKLSAKSDELVVRENSLPKACPVVLFLSPKSLAWEKQLEMTASVSFSLMDVGCAHFIAWNSVSNGDLLRTRVDDEESFYLFLTTMMQDIAFDEEQDIVSVYRQKYRGEHFLYEIEIDKNGDIILNGQKSFELILK